MPHNPCQPAYCLRAANRLRHSADFAVLRQVGKRFATPAFLLYACAQPLRHGSEPGANGPAIPAEPALDKPVAAGVCAPGAQLTAVPRLGVVASRRVGSAVKRNHGKRWTREVFRVCKGQLPSTSSVMVVLRTGFDTLTFEAFAAQLIKALRISLGLRELHVDWPGSGLSGPVKARPAPVQPGLS
jgi:ribonuclease P protein component